MLFMEALLVLEDHAGPYLDSIYVCMGLVE